MFLFKTILLAASIILIGNAVLFLHVMTSFIEKSYQENCSRKQESS